MRLFERDNSVEREGGKTFKISFNKKGGDEVSKYSIKEVIAKKLNSLNLNLIK